MLRPYLINLGGGDLNTTALVLRLLVLSQCKITLHTKSQDYLATLKSVDSSGKMVETGRTNIAKSSFFGDAPRIWNKAPTSVTQAKSLTIAKKPKKKLENLLKHYQFKNDQCNVKACVKMCSPKMQFCFLKIVV